MSVSPSHPPRVVAVKWKVTAHVTDALPPPPDGEHLEWRRIALDSLPCLCGADLYGDITVLPSWGDWVRCTPCLAVAGMRGYRISDAAVGPEPKAGWDD